MIAVMPTEIATLTFGGVVKRMDLGDPLAIVFLSGAHGAINVTYRRSDDNIGWIDPCNTPMD